MVARDAQKYPPRLLELTGGAQPVQLIALRLTGLVVKLPKGCSVHRLKRKKSGLIIGAKDCKPSKPILDEIDTVLAGHYGFTAEELDFLLNYDIKYRLGRSTEEEE